MKLISEQRYDKNDIRIVERIVTILTYAEFQKYSFEFFLSDKFFVVKTYRKVDNE